MTIRKKKGPKQRTEKYWETIYCNIILARLMLEKCMGIKNTKANAGKWNLSCNIVNVMGGNNLRALKRPNKGRKYNGNTFKDRSNRTKRLVLLSRCPSR